MNANFEHMDELIAMFLAGEAGREDIAKLEAWRREASTHEEYYQQTLNLLKAIATHSQQQTVDVDKAWEKLQARISQGGEAKVIPFYRNPKIFRAAASLLLVLALGFIIRTLVVTETPEPMVIAATKAPIEEKLPDGSKVFINKNSEISYVVKGNKREVKLKGEAYFDVVHNEEQPFEITIDDVVIRDIGTAFNVKAIPGSDLIEVLVESGEVQFYSATNKGLNLVKGEKATYNRVTKEFRKSIPDPIENTTSYKSKIFHFKETPLREVLRQINGIYESNIKLADDRIGDCRLSVVFTNEKIEVVVDVIAETLDLEAVSAGDTLVLKGTPCAER